jgi:hypothetical protein
VKWDSRCCEAARGRSDRPGKNRTTRKVNSATKYQRGAGAGEPNALARVALEEDRAALAAANAADRDAHLLRAFRLYAAAAERARIEDWPDDAWRSWRYRRASLARLLAREGMMRQVAEAYGAVRTQYATSVSPLRRLLTSLLGRN